MLVFLFLIIFVQAVVLSVFRTAHNLKIFNSIVPFVFIDVMDNFSCKKFSSKMFSHYNPMFLLIPFLASTFPFKDISANNFASTIFPAGVIFSEFFNRIIGAYVTAIRSFFYSCNIFFIAASASLLVVNCPHIVKLLNKLFCALPFKFCPWLVPNSGSCMSPRFGDIFEFHGNSLYMNNMRMFEIKGEKQNAVF